MKALTAALALHALFGLICLHRAVVRGEWAQSACAFLVASSGVYLVLGMFRALRRAEAQFERREQAEERRRAFREMVKADHRPGAGTGGTGAAKPPTAHSGP
ncbi:MAG: hypothetical protein JWM59_3953 [Verrucomicrobiales bacterium]|nr:hypothetical protein [Verrucomicrobiales bacterium]